MTVPERSRVLLLCRRVKDGLSEEKPGIEGEAMMMPELERRNSWTSPEDEDGDKIGRARKEI